MPHIPNTQEEIIPPIEPVVPPVDPVTPPIVPPVVPPIAPVTPPVAPVAPPVAPVAPPTPQIQNLGSLFNINTLGSGDIAYLAEQAKARNAGEGMTQYNQAMDQIRFMELERIKNSGNQAYIDAFKASGIETDQSNVQYYSPIAAMNAFLAKQNKETEDFSQIATDYNQQSITGQGEKQAESSAYRLSLPTTGGIISSGASYRDDKFNIDVSAPTGTFAVLYANGGVEYRKLPTSGRIPSPSEITASTRAGADVGAVGKKVLRTGNTLFNPKSGADVTAPEGKYVVEYEDGTFEFRDKTGGFIPSPEQFKTGGDSSAATAVTGAGKTKAELQLEQGLTPEGAEQGGNGLAMSSSLEVIGTTYTTPDGQKRTAPKGQVFMQDPKTKKILLRPESQAQYGQETTSQSVLAERQKMEGSIKKYIPDTDTASLEADFKESPLGSFQKLYMKLQEAQGVTTIKGEIESMQKQQKELDDKYAETVKNINANPYLSEALRSKKTALEQSKYETQRSQLTARLQLQNSLLQDARQEAQFIATNALSQYNADRTFGLEELKFEAGRADAKADAEYKLINLAIQSKQLEQGNYKEVNGGLFDLSTKKWVINPKSDGLSQKDYAGIIADIYKTYDPEEASSVIQSMTQYFDAPDSPLSIQSIAPGAKNIGTKFGEATFAQAHHSGVDLPAPMGSPVLAPVQMQITSVGDAGGYGNAITALGTDGKSYRFAHLSGFSVKKGDNVGPGVLIGKVGSTGLSTGPHLHMEVMDKSGKFIDPVQNFGLTTDNKPVKSKVQKAQDKKDIDDRAKESVAMNQDLSKSTLFQQMNTSGASVQALQAFEKQFKLKGPTSVFSPFDTAKLSPIYSAAVLNLKEFFRLGVLNGQDQVILENVLPNPMKGVPGVADFALKTRVKSGIQNLKSSMNIGLDSTYKSIITQYGNYDKQEVTLLKDVQNRYLNQKAALNPLDKGKMDELKKAGHDDEEIIRLIYGL